MTYFVKIVHHSLFGEITFYWVGMSQRLFQAFLPSIFMFPRMSKASYCRIERCNATLLNNNGNIKEETIVYD